METSPLPVKDCKCSALMAIEQWGLFNAPHPPRHGPTIYNGHLRGPVTLTLVAERTAVELSLPVFTTWVCRVRGSNPDLPPHTRRSLLGKLKMLTCVNVQHIDCYCIKISRAAIVVFYTPCKRSLDGYIGFILSVCLSPFCRHDFAHACSKTMMHGFSKNLYTHYSPSEDVHLEFSYWLDNFSSILQAFCLFLDLVAFFLYIKQ